MKKLIIIVSTSLLLITLFLILLFTFKDKEKEEMVYSVRSNYSYLSNDEVSINVKVYSNLENSLLKYANEGSVYLHDKKEENVIMVSVLDSYISSAAIYNDDEIYEYSILLSLNITELNIKECYLSLKFSNKGYTFNIGRVEINKKEYEYKSLNITNLYGVSSEESLNLSALIISFNNKANDNWNITKAIIGGYGEVVLDKENTVMVSDSIKIEGYTFKTEQVSNNLIVESNTNKTFILPIIKSDEYYLYNCYLLILINGEQYYISNFDYIKSNDLNGLDKYVSSGLIYEI